MDERSAFTGKKKEVVSGGGEVMEEDIPKYAAWSGSGLGFNQQRQEIRNSCFLKSRGRGWERDPGRRVRDRVGQEHELVHGDKEFLLSPERPKEFRTYKTKNNKKLDFCSLLLRAPLVAQMVKRLPRWRETWVGSLGQEDPLEKEMATHSSTLAWKIPWMEESGRLQSIGLPRVGHD